MEPLKFVFIDWSLLLLFIHSKQTLMLYKILFMLKTNVSIISFFFKVKQFPDIVLPACCPACKEPGVLCQLPASGTIIVVNEKGTRTTISLLCV